MKTIDEKKSGMTNLAVADRVPLGMKFGYSVGDFGANLGFQMTAFYLMYFFTDVFGILPALAGTIFLISKLWNAVSTPIMGYIVDRTNSRWGKMRPYLLFGALPLGVAVGLLFYSPDIPADYRFYWGLLTFILFCTAITVVNVPFLAMTPSLTLDSHERSVVTGFRVTFGIVGTLTAAGATLPLVGLFGNGTQLIGFRVTGILYGVVITLVSLISFATVKERVARQREERTTLRENITVIVQNRPFLLLTLGTLMHMIGMSVMAVVVNYYFKYNLHAESIIPIAFLSLFVTAALSLPLFVFISKKRSKKFTYNLGMGIVVANLLLIFLFGERIITVGGKEIPLVMIFFVITGIGLSTNWLSPWSMIPDTVEYSQWKTGLRREGILYGTFYFVFMIGTAFAAFLVGNILALTGYVPNIQQTPVTLLGIRCILTLVPMVFLTAGIFFISLFPIDAAMHKRMIADIEVNKK
jgi:GPH family glycoside/pentoside/hexuronide:cation symporter